MVSESEGRAEAARCNLCWIAGALAIVGVAVASDYFHHDNSLAPLLYLLGVLLASLARISAATFGVASAASLAILGTHFTTEFHQLPPHELLHGIIPVAAVWAIAYLARRRDIEFAKLRAAESKFQQVFRSAVESTALLNSQGQFIDGNDATLKLFGLDSIDQLIGLTPTDVSPESQPDGTPSAGQAELMIGKAMEQGFHRFEWTLLNTRGELIDTEISLGRVEIGGEVFAQGICRDISEQKRVQARLLESQAELQTVYDAISDTILIADAETLQFVHANEAASRAFGYTHEELLGLKIPSMHPAEAKEQASQSIQKVLSGDALTIQEIPCIRKDGSIFHADIQTRPITYCGKPHLFAMVRDVSERRDAAMELKIARQAIDTATIGIAMADLSESITYANQAWADMFGARDKSEPLGTSPRDWARDPAIMDEMLTALGESGGWIGELPVHKVDGSPLDVQLSANLVTDDQGRPLCLMGSFIDLTEIKAAEAERLNLERRLMESARMESLGFLAGGVAHDFNNLLGAMLVNVSYLQMKLDKSDLQQERLRQIGVAISSATELCTQLLTYAGKRKTPGQNVCLFAALRDLSSLLQASISHKIELVIQDRNGKQQALGDRSQIEQVILNLITNAADAIGDTTGSIHVGVSEVDLTREDIQGMILREWAEPGPYLCLQVRDTGPGMQPELMQKVFDPFFSTKFPGRGLGLSTVRGVLESHKGALRVISTPGIGTTFEAFFPVSPGAPTPAAERTSAGHDLPVRMKEALRILVVDDEPDLREIISATLREFGHAVTCAGDGAEALATLAMQPEGFDLMLLDLTMPHMSGQDVLSEARAHYPGLPVVLMTGYSARDVSAHSSVLADVPVLEKPFTIDMLLAKLETLSPSRRASRPQAG